MQRSVGTIIGWSMAFLALAGCSDGTTGTPAGGGGMGGSANSGQAGTNQPTAGTVGTTAGTSGTGTAGTGGSAAGTGGAQASGGTTGTAGSGGGGGATAGTTGGGGGAAGTTGGGGGAAGNGGTAGRGGTTGTGGAAGRGGTTGTGGAAGTAGTAGRGGTTGTGGAAGTGGAGGADWISLFNGRDLTGWTPSPGHAALFAADTLAGEPAIHVYPTQADQSTQAQATLRTNQSYSNYILHLEYKWGTKRYSDRKQTFRDSGVCFHLCNSLTAVWPDAAELQIGSSPLGGDWITGDIFMLLYGRTRADWPNTNGTYNENGTRTELGSGGNYRGKVAVQLDKATDWNVVELTVHGSRDAEYRVNGTVVNRLYNLECSIGGTWQPLDRGPIAVQAEFAELYFRNIQIKILP